MSHTRHKNEIKIQAKRNVELWIYSFADMYMILSVFFIALSVIYAAKAKKEVREVHEMIASAGRGPAAVESSIAVDFPKGTADLTQETIESLSLMLPVMKASQNSLIEVEGYADGAPVKKDSLFTSNLDLASKRAVNVSEWFVKNGINSGRIRTVSFGNSYQFSLGEKVKTNRRVVIKLTQSGGHQ